MSADVGTAKSLLALTGRRLATMAVMLVAASCSSAAGDPTNLQRPLEFFGSTSGCPSGGNGGLSPETYIAQKFPDRLADGKTQWPLNVRCVTRDYSSSDIERWRLSGDRVAAYAQLSQANANWEQVCRKRPEIEATLQSLAPTNDRQSAASQGFPELIFLIGMVRDECLEPPAGDQYYAQSVQLGFNSLNYAQLLGGEG